MIKVVAFDLDDTLWDLRPVLLRAEEHLNGWLADRVPTLRYTVEEMRPLRTVVLSEDPGLAGRITELRRRVIEQAMVNSGITRAEARRLSDEAMDVFLHARHQVELFDGALEVIQALSKSFVLGVLTNGNADIRRLGLHGLFDFAFCAEEVGAPKPADDLFRAALAHTSSAPAEMVYVGDDPLLDVDPANRLGIRTIWVKRPNEERAGETRADEVVPHVREVPAAIDRLQRR
jgi:HAD superfamily hydrolase (TIGR01509 family)